MTNNYQPTEAVDQLNFLATVQFDLDAARTESNVMSSAIRRRSDVDKHDPKQDSKYNPRQDNAALRVVRTAIDGLQARLDAHIAAHGPVVNAEAKSLSHEAFDLGSVISEYVTAYLSPKEVKA